MKTSNIKISLGQNTTRLKRLRDKKTIRLKSVSKVNRIVCRSYVRTPLIITFLFFFVCVKIVFTEITKNRSGPSRSTVLLGENRLTLKKLHTACWLWAENLGMCLWRRPFERYLPVENISDYERYDRKKTRSSVRVSSFFRPKSRYSDRVWREGWRPEDVPPPFDGRRLNGFLVLSARASSVLVTTSPLTWRRPCTGHPGAGKNALSNWTENPPV